MSGQGREGGPAADAETSLDTRFAQAMGQLLGPAFPDDIALAVSGGGDSMAMLALSHGWARVWGPRLWVVTVDHGLRPESAAEAEMVAAFCADLGRPHATLRWRWDGSGNLQDAARRARLDLIDRWRCGISHVLMAHTADDVAETFLMRLARGSGVEGLSALEPRRHVTPHRGERPPLAPDDVSQTVEPPLPSRQTSDDPSMSAGFDIVRPCFDMTRAELRHYARTLSVPWVEDPSNDDPKYDRSRARKILAGLENLGLTRANLVSTARRMRRASEALRARALSVADEVAQEVGGAVKFDRAGFERIERDTQLRLLAAACMWVSGAEYRPRAASLDDLLDRLLGGGDGTLIGAQARAQGDRIDVTREPATVAEATAPFRPGVLWDGRWRIDGPPEPTLTVRALGDGLSQRPDWRDAGLPRPTLLASPALWEGDELRAAPLLDAQSPWSAHIVTPFASFLVSH